MSQDLPLSDKQKLERARHNVRVTEVAAMRPGLTPHQLGLYRELNRSFRAEVKLAQKALDYANKKTNESVR